MQGSLSLSETGVPPICHQQAWGCVDTPMSQIPQILPVAPGLEAGIDLLSLPVSSLIIPCNWNTACAPDPLSSLPKALQSLLIALGFLVATSSQPT